MGLGVVSLVVCFGAVASFGYAYNRFAIGRAMVQNIRNFSVREGGSTIT